jgi:hypothetical protein
VDPSPDTLQPLFTLCKAFYVPDRPGVYLLQGGDLVKIGTTSVSLRQRITGLQAGSPVQLRLLWFVEGARRSVETKLHERFASARHHGEWFEARAIRRELATAIKRARNDMKIFSREEIGAARDLREIAFRKKVHLYLVGQEEGREDQKDIAAAAPEVQTCPSCGLEFSPGWRGSPQIYCSVSCRVTAYRLRKIGGVR